MDRSSPRAPDPSTPARPSRQIWLLYALGWLPILVALAAFLAITYPDAPVRYAVRSAFRQLAPAALMGVLVWQACFRRPWSGAGIGRFVVGHLLGAVLYAVGLVLLLRAAASVEHLIVSGELTWWEWETQITAWHLLLSLLLYLSLVTSAHLVVVGRDLSDQRARAERAEALRNQVELTALRAQLNPHFLFNTLHSLAGLAKHDPELTSEKLDQFGDLFRYSLSVLRREEDRVPFAEEWAFVGNYLSLERLRLGDRLHLEARIDPEVLTRTVPAFSLQPLVENAIKHGVAPHAGTGHVRIVAQVVDDQVWIEVTDDGPGPSSLDAPGRSGVGLQVLRRRLANIYGPAAELLLDPAAEAGFRARLRLPVDAPPRLEVPV